MENFKKYSTAVANLEGFYQEIGKQLTEKANKEVASDPINLGLTATVAHLLLLRLVTLESVKSAHTHVSNVLSSIVERANDSSQTNSHEEHENFVEKRVPVLSR